MFWLFFMLKKSHGKRLFSTNQMAGNSKTVSLLKKIRSLSKGTTVETLIRTAALIQFSQNFGLDLVSKMRLLIELRLLFESGYYYSGYGIQSGQHFSFQCLFVTYSALKCCFFHEFLLSLWSVTSNFEEWTSNLNKKQFIYSI